MRKEDNRQRETVKIIVLYLVLICAMQLYDSYCAAIYDRIQSLFLTELVINRYCMGSEEAVAYLNQFAIPFYFIGALAPGVRMLVDKYGKDIIFIGNMVLLLMGCACCMFASNLIVYLIGNGIVVFCTTLDIQYIYLVEHIPQRWHATVRGAAGGVAAGAAMLIPIFRKVMLENGSSWRGLYRIGIMMGLVVTVLSWLLLRACQKKDDSRTKLHHKKEAVSHTDSHAEKQPASILLQFKDICTSIWKHQNMRQYMILLFSLGIAVSGVTFYNEPLVSFNLQNENQINMILFIQPFVTLIITVMSGWMADMFGRRNIFIANLVMTGIAVVGFLTAIHQERMLIIIGIFWGVMIGSFFAAANLLTLMAMEEAPESRIGSISAMSTYVNGAGNAIGMIVSCVLIRSLSMEAVKLVLTIPVFIVIVSAILVHAGRQRAD